MYHWKKHYFNTFFNFINTNKISSNGCKYNSKLLTLELLLAVFKNI